MTARAGSASGESRFERLVERVRRIDDRLGSPAPGGHRGLHQDREQLKSTWPTLWRSTGFYSTEIFPLNAFVSLNVSGPPFGEDVVLFATVQVHESTCRFSSDIPEGEGHVLADGPEAAWPADAPLEDQLARARTGLEKYFEFLTDHVRS